MKTVKELLKSIVSIDGDYGPTIDMYLIDIKIPSHIDIDGIELVSPISLNGGTIKNASNVAAPLTFTPPTTTGVLVDGIVPAITSVSAPASQTY